MIPSSFFASAEGWLSQCDPPATLGRRSLHFFVVVARLTLWTSCFQCVILSCLSRRCASSCFKSKHMFLTWCCCVKDRAHGGVRFSVMPRSPLPRLLVWERSLEHRRECQRCRLAIAPHTNTSPEESLDTPPTAHNHKVAHRFSRKWDPAMEWLGSTRWVHEAGDLCSASDQKSIARWRSTSKPIASRMRHNIRQVFKSFEMLSRRHLTLAFGYVLCFIRVVSKYCVVKIPLCFQ